ncbi:MAG: hypothetical protein H6553_08770 [Chitinophagales bacterium]|nr:hypothetical protein [Chitinophagales bacterium]
MKKSNQWKLGLLVANLFPLVGVLEQNWSLFIVLYIYWFETLIQSFFNAVKIISTPNYVGKWSKGITYFIVRFGVFIFYSIFLIVFIGFLEQTDEGRMQNLMAIAFKNKLVNITILNFIIFNLFDYIFNYKLSLSAEEKQMTIKKYTVFFNARTLVMHIVIILCAIVYSFLANKIIHNKIIINIILFSIFIGIKSLADLFSNSYAENIK